MKADADPGYSGEEKEREAIGGFLSPARHAPDGEQSKEPLGGAHTGTREVTGLSGPPGDVNTRNQVSPEDEEARLPPVGDGSDRMTAAEQSGQVAFGAGDSSGGTGPIGAESSSG